MKKERWKAGEHVTMDIHVYKIHTKSDYGFVIDRRTKIIKKA